MYLAAAQQVIQQIAALGIASSNRPSDLAAYGEQTVQARHTELTDAYVESGVLAMEGKPYVKGVAAAVRQKRAGNCEELACLAFDMLATRGIRPLELMALMVPDEDPPETMLSAITGVEAEFGGPDHAFVVIGRVGGDLRDYRTWNADTVVCDPWAKRAYKSYWFDQEMDLIRRVSGGYTRTKQVTEHRNGAW